MSGCRSGCLRYADKGKGLSANVRWGVTSDREKMNPGEYSGVTQMEQKSLKKKPCYEALQG